MFIKKQPIAISFIRSYFKTSTGALVSTLLILVLFFPVFFELKISPDLSVISSFASAIATVIICLFTVKSVLEVIKSNEENIKNNQSRDRKESFEKKFALLLKEHNNYLNKLTKTNNVFYQLDYILNCSGYESRDLIRGDAKFVTIDGDKFYYSNNNLLVKLDILTNKEQTRIYFNPSAGKVKEYKLEKLYEKIDIYASNDCFYWYFEHLDKVIEMSYTPSFFESDDVKSIVESKIKKGNNQVPALIKRNNNISKNILSPYMRIIYHLLKASKENATNKDDMKKYTNIVRSIIPYDILMLVAINAMYFYKSSNESKNEIKRWNEFFNDFDDPHSSIFNDYYKYYQLLIECDFFDHLIMSFSDVMIKLESVILDADISEIKTMTCKSDKPRIKSSEPKRYLLIYGDTEYNLSKIYKRITEATMKLETDVLVLMFFNQDRRVETIKERIMDDFIFKNRSISGEGRLKSKLYDTIYTRTSFVYKEESIMNLSRDFYGLYTKGELPEMFNNGFCG